MRYCFFCALIMLSFVKVAGQDESVSSYLQSAIDNPTPYVGQPIKYILRIYDAGLPSDASLSLPSFEGFGQTTLESPDTFVEVVDGFPYNVITQEVLLYPLRGGDFVIQPSYLNVSETAFENRQRLASLALAVNVQPLPLNAPVSFQNAVGQFTASWATDVTESLAGGVVILTLAIDGDGNIKNILAPDFKLDTNQWRVLPRSPNLVMQTSTLGTKQFQWVLIPKRTGFLEISALEFSFFNLDTQQYQVKQLESITIAVETTSSNNPPEIPQEVAPIVFLQNSTPSYFQAQLPSFIEWLLWAVLPIIALVVFLIKTIKPSRRTSKIELSAIKSHLQSLATQPPYEAYTGFSTQLKNYTRIRASQQQLTPEQWLQQLPPQLQKQLKEHLEDAKQARYSTATHEDKKVFALRTYKLIVAIENSQTKGVK